MIGEKLLSQCVRESEDHEEQQIDIHDVKVIFFSCFKTHCLFVVSNME